jgi:transposase
MAKLDKDDLAQMNENYFKSLEKERLVEVAKNLHQLATFFMGKATAEFVQ